MTVILKSLDVVSASERVAESVSVRFGDSAVDMVFKRSIVADYATRWTSGNVGHQRLYLVGRRTTSVATAQEGPVEAMKHALAASSAKEACVASNAKGVPASNSTTTASAASDADVDDENQRETSVVDWISNVLHHHDQVAESRGKARKTSRRTGCDHDDDAGCTQSGRSQVQELRGAMCETSVPSVRKCRKIVLSRNQSTSQRS